MDAKHTRPDPARHPDGHAMLEDIRGPLFGWHVAAYTLHRPEGFYAFAKICGRKPASVWETPDARAIVSVGPGPDAAAALEGVFRLVYRRLSAQRANQPTRPGELEASGGPGRG